MRLFSSLPNNLKDVTAFDEKHDAVYCSVCATANCNADYIGVCARRLNLIERVKNHIGRDRNSHMVLNKRQNVEMNQYPKVISKLLLTVLEITLIQRKKVKC